MSKEKRREFIKKLSKLTEPDFGLLRLEFPEAAGQIDATGAVQHRVAQLVNWAESATGPGLDELMSSAQQLWPETLGSLTEAEKSAIVEQFSDPLKAEPPSEVTDEAFKQLVDRTIEAVREGQHSKYEVH